MKADCIIVLGADPKSHLDLMHQRIDKAIQLFNKDKTKTQILMTGKYSLRFAQDPGFRESEIMKEYAIKKGIPARFILVEKESRDTLGNAYFCKQIAKEKGWKNIIVVTSDFHMNKARFIFGFVFGLGYEIAYESAPSNITDEERTLLFPQSEKESMEVLKELLVKNDIHRGQDDKIGLLCRNFYTSLNKNESKLNDKSFVNK